MAKIGLRELADSLARINIDALADEVVLGNGDLAVKLNQNQLLDGEMPNGTQIVPEYASEFYAKFKNTRNPRPTIGVPDLNLTGSFYNGMKLKPDLTISSSDSKAGAIKSKYGDVQGLQKENELTFRRANDLDFIKELKKQTGL